MQTLNYEVNIGEQLDVDWEQQQPEWPDLRLTDLVYKTSPPGTVQIHVFRFDALDSI